MTGAYSAQKGTLMSQDNHVVLTGNLTRDPERRTFPSGGSVVQFSMALNKAPKKDGTELPPVFVDVKVPFTGTADNVVESLRKGDRVTVVGELDGYSTEITNQAGEVKNIGRLQVAAFEVAVNLRFATAKPVKVHRDGAGNANGAQAAPAVQAAAPAAAPAMASSGGSDDF